MLQVIEAPSEDLAVPEHATLFLAGGITDCPDWQAEAIKRLGEADTLTVYNPRRAQWPGTADQLEGVRQIQWEYIRLHSAQAVLFWFPAETLCPIVLYELGAALERGGQQLFIGTDPKYGRRLDVRVQALLRRPEVWPVLTSVEALCDRVLHWNQAK